MIWQVLNRQKDIQYASRTARNKTRQRQLNRLQHVIAELTRLLPLGIAERDNVRVLADHGCMTQMHVVRLLAPTLPGEDHLKEFDFARAASRRGGQQGWPIPSVGWLPRHGTTLPIRWTSLCCMIPGRHGKLGKKYR